ncbi:Uncharacterised protein [Pseudomonas mucidolens]|nr:Uncharacterised protein [Pseudomonas mucidolens]
MFGGQVGFDRLASKSAELAVIRIRACAPEVGTTDIGQTRTKVITEQVEQPEYHIAVDAGVAHDLCWLQFGLLFQHNRKQYQAVTQGGGTVMAFRPKN